MTLLLATLFFLLPPKLFLKSLRLLGALEAGGFQFFRFLGIRIFCQTLSLDLVDSGMD